MQTDRPPKEFMGYHFSPDKKVYVGSVILKNVPGALASVAIELGREGVNLIGSESANIRGTETSVWGFFAEADGAEMDVDKIKEVLSRSPNVLRVELSEGPDGVVVDRYHYPLAFNTGEQAMMLRRQDLVDMFSRIKKIFGSGANLIIYELGLATGESDAKELKRVIGDDRVARNLVDLIYLYSAQGWGWPELVDLSLQPLAATFRIHNNFECSYTKSSAPNSHFIRGHIVGLGLEIFGKKVDVVETKCIAKGDPYCEFVSAEIG